MRHFLLAFAVVIAGCSDRPAASGMPDTTLATLEKGCAAKRGADCASLGGRYQEGNGVPHDLAAAAKYYQLGCDANDAASCHLIGQAYLIGAGVARDVERAMPLLQGACELGDAHGCYKLGAVHVGGAFGPARDTAMGLKLLGKACDLNHAAGCYRAGSTLETGAQGVEADLVRARSYYRRGCGVTGDSKLPEQITSEGQASACWRLGLTSDSERTGSTDQKTAAALVRLATDYYSGECEAGRSQGCYVLGAMYAAGEGVEPDAARAKELFGRACGLGNAAACQAAEATEAP